MPLDLGCAILGAIVFSALGYHPLTFWLIAFCVVCSFLPDFDFIAGVFSPKTYGKMSHEHRNLLHYPLILLLVGFAIISLRSIPFAVLFVVLVFLHFLHDSIGVGWGIRWLYPFSKKYYKFFDNGKGGFSNRIVMSWTPEEQQQTAEEYGNPNWIRDYLKSPAFFAECALLVIALLALVAVRHFL